VRAGFCSILLAVEDNTEEGTVHRDATIVVHEAASPCEKIICLSVNVSIVLPSLTFESNI
jgi:hypothetical protein